MFFWGRQSIFYILNFLICTHFLVTKLTEYLDDWRGELRQLACPLIMLCISTSSKLPRAAVIHESKWYYQVSWWCLLLPPSDSLLDSSVLPSLTGSLPVESRRLEERFSSTFDRFLWLSGSSVSLKRRKHVVHWCKWGEARVRRLVVYLKCHLIKKKKKSTNVRVSRL